jgi:dynein heavy chain
MCEVEEQSIFKGGKVQASSFLRAKKAKVNPGIPTAVLIKDFELRSEKGAVIPPITPDTSSQENIALAVEQQEMQVDKKQEPVEDNDRNPFTFLEFLEKYPETKEFVYLVSATNGNTYNPYNLTIVNFFEIDTKSPDGYYTLSSQVDG